MRNKIIFKVLNFILKLIYIYIVKNILMYAKNNRKRLLKYPLFVGKYTKYFNINENL